MLFSQNPHWGGGGEEKKRKKEKQRKALTILLGGSHSASNFSAPAFRSVKISRMDMDPRTTTIILPVLWSATMKYGICNCIIWFSLLSIHETASAAKFSVSKQMSED
jgi:hypothetical protein